MALTPREEKIVKLTDMLVRQRVQALPEYPFNCAFMWGFVTIPRPNGKSVSIKHCFGSMDCSQTQAKKVAETVPGVHITHFNMD